MDNQPIRRIQRPLGIPVLCLAIILAHGGLHLLTYLQKYSIPGVEVSFFTTLITVFLFIFTFASLVWFYYGDNLARIVFLIFDTLHVIWFIYIVFTIEETEPFYLSYVSRLAGSLVVLGFCLVYFNKSEVIQYYKQYD